MRYHIVIKPIKDTHFSGDIARAIEAANLYGFQKCAFDFRQNIYTIRPDEPEFALVKVVPDRGSTSMFPPESVTCDSWNHLETELATVVNSLTGPIQWGVLVAAREQHHSISTIIVERVFAEKVHDTSTDGEWYVETWRTGRHLEEWSSAVQWRLDRTSGPARRYLAAINGGITREDYFIQGEHVHSFQEIIDAPNKEKAICDYLETHGEQFSFVIKQLLLDEVITIDEMFKENLGIL